jgi:hypothetical protein
MAVSNKIFVSPGVYTSERDLSFVAQSVGVTTLGLVGETQIGPAFEPIFITNYDEFESFFGGTLPEKFENTQIPKYELAYIAKSYLQQSNQLFVTRVLGLSGYDAGPSWSLLTVANVDPSTVALNGVSTSFSVGFTGCTDGTGVTFTSNGSFAPQILGNLNSPYPMLNGGESSIGEDISDFLQGIVDLPVSSGYTAAYFGTIPDANFNALSPTYTASTNIFGVSGLSESTADFTSPNDDSWYYSNFDLTGTTGYSGYSFFGVVTQLDAFGPSGCFSGTVSGTVFNYAGTAYDGWGNLVVATWRSRGISLYGNNQHGPSYTVTGTTDVIIDCSGIYSGITFNPYATFNLSGVTADGTDFAFATSINSGDPNYITKVFGVSNFGKPRNEVPLFIEEQFQNMVNYGYNQGYIRGLQCTPLALPGLRYSPNTATIANYVEKYQDAESPWVVSELEGTTVDKLFRFITIADGNGANAQIKITIENISFNNSSFDVGIRSFYDTDSNPVYLEKFTQCTMDPTSNSYIGVKIGTSDGEYALLSKYVMLELNNKADFDSLPCGFEGYIIRSYASAQPPYPVYKSSYDFPGEVIGNPPFNIPFGPNQIISPGDNVRRTFLGISSQLGYDPDFFQYKGRQAPTNLCNVDSLPWGYITKGFHMDSGATVVTITSGPTAGTPAFDCGDASFQSDPTDPANPYYTIQARKFAFLVQGGFDGWDIYREYRTNDDRYQIGGSLWQRGACQSTRYPLANGWGAFKLIAQDGFSEFSTSDYYAYLLGIATFNNPEAVNINVFATPGIDYLTNSNLVEQAIDMVTFQRADSLYIVTTPDCNVLLPTNTDNITPPTEAVDNLSNTGIDSNYTATYYPWILVRDTVNNTQIYIPPTNEVCRNLALTDNISFPWFATAGYTRGLVNAVKARIKLTQDQRDTLYQGRINPIATFSDVGTVIWGNKTLQIADTALNRINVRRLLLQARKLISAVAVRLLFEQNDAKVRQDFLDSVNPILDAIRRDRGLYDFRVTVSNDPADLDRNTMTGKIYLKPTRALEFIDIEFLITPTGASFENI